MQNRGTFECSFCRMSFEASIHFNPARGNADPAECVRCGALSEPTRETAARLHGSVSDSNSTSAA